MIMIKLKTAWHQTIRWQKKTTKKTLDDLFLVVTIFWRHPSPKRLLQNKTSISIMGPWDFFVRPVVINISFHVDWWKRLWGRILRTVVQWSWPQNGCFQAKWPTSLYGRPIAPSMWAFKRLRPTDVQRKSPGRRVARSFRYRATRLKSQSLDGQDESHSSPAAWN